MPDDARDDHRNHAGLLTRLRRDRRGNVLAMSAAMILPLAALVGGGLDVSRMYIARTRLQHACDAGALAGRKAMGAGNWNQAGDTPRTTAQQFFDSNWPAGGYGSDSLARQFTEHAGKVNGTASVRMPTSVMRIFGKPNVTLSVACDAEMRLPNTDVMFVLDTTGSMNDPQPGDNVTKIAALRTAVKCFYEIVARLDTNAECKTGTPSGGTGDQVQIRFGFVPYASNVNVGRLLPTGWFADAWTYQTRAPRMRSETYETTTDGPWQNGTQATMEKEELTVDKSGQAEVVRQQNVGNGACNGDPDDPIKYSGAEGAPYNQTETVSGTRRTVRWSTRTNYTRYYHRGAEKHGSICYHGRQWQEGHSVRTYSRVDTRTQTKTTHTRDVFDHWSYWRHELDIRKLKNGNAWNAAVDLPVGSSGAMVSIPWDGCIEERKTVRTKDHASVLGGSRNDKAWDLDIDLVPVSTEVYSLWGPTLPRAIYTPKGSSVSNWNRDEINTAENYDRNVSYNCPSEGKLMQKWPDPQVAGQPKFDRYVDSLTVSGATYHDIGLLWGARFLSPTGLFAATNARTPQGGDIERHLIFMTDGDPCTYSNVYAAYGMAWFDRRQTDEQAVPTFGCTEQGTITEQVNLRTAALCTAIKNKSITLWVVAFGSLAKSTERRLNACATPGRYFVATNAETLQQTFKSIADQISMLRLTS